MASKILYGGNTQVVEDEEAAEVLRSIIRDEMNHIKALSSLGEESIEETVTKEKRFH